jgi:hypothetical protein
MLRLHRMLYGHTVCVEGGTELCNPHSVSSIVRGLTAGRPGYVEFGCGSEGHSPSLSTARLQAARCKVALRGTSVRRAKESGSERETLWKKMSGRPC